MNFHFLFQNAGKGYGQIFHDISSQTSSKPSGVAGIFPRGWGALGALLLCVCVGGGTYEALG